MIRLAATAAADLSHIDTWILANAGATVANRISHNILSSIEQLATFPHSGRAGRRTGTRELVISRLPYIIVYRLRGRDVTIIRIIHSAMLWPPVGDDR